MVVALLFAVLLVVTVTAITDYRLSLQFQIQNEDKRNIKVEEVVRGGRTEVSVFDLVVGAVVPLKIGDQIPAYGILISGHYLSVDESSMTGESKHVHKDQKTPFSISGCKVVDGYGIMLVMRRSSPKDKLVLVQSLRRKGHVVAVTVDGTNDACALFEVLKLPKKA